MAETKMIEALYKAFETLDKAGDDFDRYGPSYDSILKAAQSGNIACMKLAAQFIPRFFFKFPQKQDNSLDALFTIIETQDLVLRKLTIKNCADLCDKTGDHVPKILDVLTQLLQSQDLHEKQLLNNLIVAKLKPEYIKGVLEAMFTNVAESELEILRSEIWKFLTQNIQAINKNANDKEIESFIVDNMKKIMMKSQGDDYANCLRILEKLPSYQSMQGRKELLTIVQETADFDKPFEPKNGKRVQQIADSARHQMIFLSKNVTSNTLVVYFIEKVLPFLESVTAYNKQDANAVQLNLIRVLAELVPHSTKLEAKYIDAVYNRAYATMPNQDAKVSVTNENDEQKLAATVPFKELEALFIALHQLVKRHPEFFTTNDSERKYPFEEFKKKLVFFARLTQVHQNKLRTELKGKDRLEQNKPEYKQMLADLRVTESLTSVLKDFLRRSYNEAPKMSWTTAQSVKRLRVEVPEEKHANDATISNGSAKSAKPESKIRTGRRPVQPPETYKPPSGKYSKGVDMSLDDVVVANGGFKNQAKKRTAFSEITIEDGSSKHPRISF